MSEILSQEEIDQLLTAIDSNGKQITGFSSIESFEKFYIEKEFHPEKPYGLFDRDVSICRYFKSGNNDNILADIMRKNEEQGMGNIKIPNTDITLINYSYCPKCKSIFSFNDIMNYYKKPKPDAWFKNTAHQLRKDTRVYCGNCDTYFLPSLIISDGTPKKEVQFLCRVQTVEAVEEYMLSKNIRVLTRDSNNILIRKNNLRAIKNDVSIKDLEKKPTLITNIIQYTPYKLIMNFINGTNVKKGDLLFDEWRDAA
jgi:hypothetical protein